MLNQKKIPNLWIILKKRIVIKGIKTKSKIKRKSKAALKIYKGSL